MILFAALFYSQLTCDQASDIISRMKGQQHLPKGTVEELIDTVKQSTPECFNE